MPIKWFPIIIASGLCLAATISAQEARQSTAPAQTEQPAAQRQPETTQSGYVLKVTTRLVTLDVIAKDSHGKMVRDLKPQDLQIFEEHNAQQKIEQFEFVDKSATAKPSEDFASANHRPANFYSNQLPIDGLKIPPTVLLMDGLNTQTQNQMQGRHHLVQLLKTLPPDTPVAVFLLGTSLQVLQGFTNNAALLQTAVEHALTSTLIEQDPADDPDSTSNLMTDIDDISGSDDTDMIQTIQDFEKEQYADTIDLRARQTLDALASIGQYLSGIPGRKNLIWVSESFPFSITSTTDTGKSPFAGTRNYADQISRAANALTDAQVAVYPVDIRGLQAQQATSVTQGPVGHSRSGGPQMMAQLNREQTALWQTQGTMDLLAEETGGKSCKNTNDLSGCVVKALDDSSAYYEMAFYPQNVNWDGKFHRIVVKTSRPGVKLTYRSGYFALDAASLAKKQQPEDRLRQGCSDLLPSTAVHLTAQVVPPGEAPTPQGGLRYRVLISTDGLGFSQEGEARRMNLFLAACEYGGKNQSFRLYAKDLTTTVSGEEFQKWQESGIPDLIALTPASNTRRIRFVLVDLSTGLAGALDVPVLPSDLAKAAAPVALSPRPVMLSFLEIPDKEKTPVSPASMGSLTFHSSTGQSGSLDWNGDVLLYKGEIPVDQSASGLFNYAFGSRFHCESGRLVSTDPTARLPTLQFAFHNHDGKVAAVDLKGEHPDYQGDLPVDPSAKSIFDRVWKLSHCQAAGSQGQ